MNKRSEIVVILDRSGSMQRAKSDHEGGLQSFVDDQKELEGDQKFTLIQFDSYDPCDVVYDGAPLQDVDKIELIPRGNTPLLDAIGKGLAHVSERFSKMPSPPDHVLCMIVTDGLENASREMTKATVRSLVEEKEAAGWVMLFLGANIDAFAEASGIGISAVRSASFDNDGRGVKALYDNVSHKYGAAREELTAGRLVACSDYEFTDEERAAMKQSFTSSSLQKESNYGSVPGGGDSQSDKKAEG